MLIVPFDMAPPYGSALEWASDSLARTPALALGLSAALAVPALLMIGAVLQRRRRQQSPDATQVHSRGRTDDPTRRTEASLTERGPAWPADGWLELESAPGERHRIGRGVVRIGREADNDICIGDKTVHRYHAAIHRTDDAEFMITDLSSADGNGVTVNGRRLAEARLADGDVIELGLTKLRFNARPA